MKALDNCVIKAVSADTEGHEMIWLLETIELLDNADIEVGISLFELRIEVNSAAEFGTGEDFFDAERVDGNVGKDFVVLVARKASDAVGGIFN